MKKLNTPSYSVLLSKEKQIRSIQELYENVGNIQGSVSDDASESNPLIDKDYVDEAVASIPAGPEGPQGPTGPQGPMGPSGYSGAAEDLEVVQVSGDSVTAVMSQKAVTDSLALGGGYKDITSTLVSGRWIHPETLVEHSESGWASAIIPVSHGDKIMITGVGGRTPRLWSKLGYFNICYSMADIEITAENLVLDIDLLTHYLVVNVRTTSPYSVHKKANEQDEYLNTLIEGNGTLNLDYLFIPNHYIKNKDADPDLTIVESNEWAYCVTSCTAGDKFILTGMGGATPRGYSFVDSNWNTLEVGAKEDHYNGTILTAPTNAAFLTINANQAYYYHLEKLLSSHDLSVKDILNSDIVLPLNGLTYGIYLTRDGEFVLNDYCIHTPSITINEGIYRFSIPNWLGMRIIVSYWVNGAYKGRLYDSKNSDIWNNYKGHVYEELVPLGTDFTIYIPDCTIIVTILKISEATLTQSEINGYSLKIRKVDCGSAANCDSLRNSEIVTATNLDSARILKAYANGIVLANELDNPIVAIDGVGSPNYLHHTPSFCIVNDIVYFVMLGANRTIESGSDPTMRVIFGYFNLSTPNDITFITPFQNKNTYAGYAVTYLDACSMVYLNSENGCHVYVNAGTSTTNIILHKYFDFSTNTMSSATIANFSYNGSTVAFTDANIRNLLTDVYIGTRAQMQILCPNSYDGKIYGSYSGYGGSAVILRTSNGTTFEYVSVPSFVHESYCETTVANIGENVLAVMIRQDWAYPCQLFSFYHMDTGLWESPINIVDPQSRTCAFKFGTDWYFLHNSGYENHEDCRNRHQLLKVNGEPESDKECLLVVKDATTSVKKFYYYVYPYGSDCYIMYCNNRQSINFCKITIGDTYSDETIKQKILGLLNN